MILTILSALLVGCGGGGGGTSGSGRASGGGDDTSSKIINITEDYQIESLGKNDTIDATIKLGNTPKNLYILLTNSDKSKKSYPTIAHSTKTKVISASENKKILSRPIASTHHRILHAPAYMREFDSKIKTLLQKNLNDKYRAKNIAAKLNKRVGDSETFYYMGKHSDSDTTTATLKKVVSDIHTVFGNKTLNIWVSDDSFGDGCSKVRCTTQTMVDALADRFLKAGLDNDIYDWVTNIFGKEWGDNAASQNSGYIGANDAITILLTDISDDDSPNGGYIGYFYSINNLKHSIRSDSNEKIMFYIDSVMFANTDSDGFWQKEAYSTLAHEFQHMIHFYEKSILLTGLDKNSTDLWINEMLSEATEDLVATKIEHNGPRNVAYTDGSAGDPDNENGRYPDFTKNPTLSLTAWKNTSENYSKVSAFGTFLTRNYGGAKVLHDIIYNKFTDERAVMDAVHKTPQGKEKTFSDLLREWGVAVMLSDIESPEDLPTYNTGDFTEDHYGNSTYQLGSINFFNYSPTPVTKTATGAVKTEANYYYKIGDNLTGDITVNLKLDAHTEATLIAK